MFFSWPSGQSVNSLHSRPILGIASSPVFCRRASFVSFSTHPGRRANPSTRLCLILRHRQFYIMFWDHPYWIAFRIARIELRLGFSHIDLIVLLWDRPSCNAYWDHPFRTAARIEHLHRISGSRLSNLSYCRSDRHFDSYLRSPPQTYCTAFFIACL